MRIVFLSSGPGAESREKHKSKVVNHSMTSDGGECTTSSCGCGETKKKVAASAKKKRVVKSAKKK